MAMKTNFEESSDIHSPFVDEIANRGMVVSEAERQAIVSNRLFLAKQRADQFLSGDKPAKKATPKPPVIDKRNTGQKIIDRNEKLRQALKG